VITKEVPRIILHGDLEEANLKVREGIRQLNILKDNMGFQRLDQNVRKVRYTDGSEITCRSCFGIDEVNIYVPEREKVKEEIECELKILTFDVTGEFDLFNLVAYCIDEDEETCDLGFFSGERPFQDPRICHFSQVKYVYKDEGDIVRQGSLIHYDYFPTYQDYPMYKVIRVVNNKGMADLYLNHHIPFPMTKAWFFGALSRDLKTLYTSLLNVEEWKNVPPQEWVIYYNKYELQENDDGSMQWFCVTSGQTPKGEDLDPKMSLQANSLDRRGNCGCWLYNKEYKEWKDPDDTIYANCPDGPHESWLRKGTRATAYYKTFSINLGKFIETTRREFMFLSHEVKDLVTCKAISGKEYFYELANGMPNEFLDNPGYCGRTAISYSHYYCPTSKTLFCDYKLFYGGWSRDYELWNGFDARYPPWGKFFYDGLNDHFMSFRYYYQVRCQWEGEPHMIVCTEVNERFNGGAIRILSAPNTSAAFSGSIRVGTNHFEEGYDVAEGLLDEGGTGTEWVVMPAFYFCKPGIVTDVTEDVDEDSLKMLSPFDIEFTKEDRVGNTFIAYDEETDSLVKGAHFKKGGQWQWKITLRSSECKEREIQGKIRDFLSDSQYYNIEAIMFT